MNKSAIRSSLFVIAVMWVMAAWLLPTLASSPSHPTETPTSPTFSPVTTRLRKGLARSDPW